LFEETHRRLARELSKSLGLNLSQSKLLEEGSVYPDFQESFPHHVGKEDEIEELLSKARATFLKGDDECYFSLGMAFHFLEDKWTMRARARDKHTKWEEMICKEQILEEQQFQKSIDASSIPSKFKKAYIDFIEILKNGIESPVFWGEYADQATYGVYKKYSFGDHFHNLGLDGLLDWCNYHQRERFKENWQINADRISQGIVSYEKENDFRHRIFLVSNYAWGTQAVIPLINAFKNLLTAEDLKVPMIRVGTTRLEGFSHKVKPKEFTRYTTPEIDLNIAFIVCREIGKRVLSKDFKWVEI
jgi:hypothetical protein